METKLESGRSYSQTERGLRELRRRIVEGYWEAGTKLKEVPLAESLAISRTPLRAALQRLEQEGLLEKSGGGYIIRSFSFADALVAIELRGVIEGTAARYAAERKLTTEDLSTIRRVLTRLDEVISRDVIDDYAALNDQFHQQLSKLSGNALIEREIERATLLPFAAPSAFSSNQDDRKRFKNSLITGQQHHRAIVQAIERGEGARAESLVREHAYLARENIEVAYRDRLENNRNVPQLALIRD